MTTQERRPARAAARAKVADTVVLPTPPEPQHTTTERSATSSGSVARAPLATAGSAPRLARPSPASGLGASAHAGALGHQRSHRLRQRVGQAPAVSAGPMDSALERRDEQMGQGQLPAQALDLLGGDGVAVQAEPPGRLERREVPRAERHAPPPPPPRPPAGPARPVRGRRRSR